MLNPSIHVRLGIALAASFVFCSCAIRCRMFRRGANLGNLRPRGFDTAVREHQSGPGQERLNKFRIHLSCSHVIVLSTLESKLHQYTPKTVHQRQASDSRRDCIHRAKKQWAGRQDEMRLQGLIGVRYMYLCCTDYVEPCAKFAVLDHSSFIQLLLRLSRCSKTVRQRVYGRRVTGPSGARPSAWRMSRRVVE